MRYEDYISCQMMILIKLLFGSRLLFLENLNLLMVQKRVFQLHWAMFRWGSVMLQLQ